MSVTTEDFSTWPDFAALLAGAENGEEDAAFTLLQTGIKEQLFPLRMYDGPQDLPEDIPRHIVQYWHDPTPPDDVSAAMASIRAKHPGFSYHCYNDGSARDFIQNHYGTGLREVYDHCPHPAMRSDFWRLCYLQEKGGIYIDADMTAIAPLTDITAGLDIATLLFYSVGRPWCIDNDVLITKAKAPLIQALLEATVERSYNGLKTGHFENIWVVSGPGAMVTGAMKWAARILREQSASALPPAQILAKAGMMLLPHPMIERALPLQRHFAYQKTEANWRNFTYAPPQDPA